MNIKDYADYINNTKKWRLDQLTDSGDPWDIDEPWTTSLYAMVMTPLYLIKIQTF